jgi:K+-sensing histidine kinase KdpD
MAAVRRVIESGESALAGDISDDVWQRDVTDTEQMERLRTAAFVSAMMVPLRVRGEVVGAIGFATAESGRHYDTQDLAIAQDIARRAGLAIENARLYSEAQHTLEQLREALSAKDEFLGMVSHELKTPITTIYGNAEVLRLRGDRLDEQSRLEAIEDVSHEAERLHRIIDNLLVLARLERGQTIDEEPLLMQRLAEKLIENHKQRYPHRTVEMHAQGDDALVLGRPVYIEQVMRNLLSNAEKYSPPQMRIEVRIQIQTAANEIEVEVLDRGSGFPEDEADRIFTPFYRSPSTEHQAQGVGIGLAVCKRLIEASGGRMWARTRKGGGAAVGFALPAIDEAAEITSEELA